MKICPVCKTKYADEKDFCARDGALLEDVQETPRARPKAKIDKKGIITAILATFAFIVFVMVLYYFLYSLR